MPLIFLDEGFVRRKIFKSSIFVAVVSRWIEGKDGFDGDEFVCERNCAWS